MQRGQASGGRPAGGRPPCGRPKAGRLPQPAESRPLCGRPWPWHGRGCGHDGATLSLSHCHDDVTVPPPLDCPDSPTVRNNPDSNNNKNNHGLDRVWEACDSSIAVFLTRGQELRRPITLRVVAKKHACYVNSMRSYVDSIVYLCSVL